MDHPSLSTSDLRHCYDCLHDQIDTLMSQWEQGKFKDQQLDAYIDELCEVRDKVSKLLKGSR